PPRPSDLVLRPPRLPVPPRRRAATTAASDIAPAAAALMDRATAHFPDRAAPHTFAGRPVQRRTQASTDQSYLLPRGVSMNSRVYSDRAGTCRQVSAAPAGFPRGRLC